MIAERRRADPRPPVAPFSNYAPSMGGRLAIHLDAEVAGRRSPGWRSARPTAAASVVARIDRWAGRLTRHSPDSELSALNADPRAEVPVGPTLAAALRAGRLANAARAKAWPTSPCSTPGWPPKGSGAEGRRSRGRWVVSPTPRWSLVARAARGGRRPQAARAPLRSGRRRQGLDRRPRPGPARRVARRGDRRRRRPGRPLRPGPDLGSGRGRSPEPGHVAGRAPPGGAGGAARSLGSGHVRHLRPPLERGRPPQPPPDRPSHRPAGRDRRRPGHGRGRLRAARRGPGQGRRHRRQRRGLRPAGQGRSPRRRRPDRPRRDARPAPDALIEAEREPRLRGTHHRARMGGHGRERGAVEAQRALQVAGGLAASPRSERARRRGGEARAAIPSRPRPASSSPRLTRMRPASAWRWARRTAVRPGWRPRPGRASRASRRGGRWRRGHRRRRRPGGEVGREDAGLVVVVLHGEHGRHLRRERAELGGGACVRARASSLAASRRAPTVSRARPARAPDGCAGGLGAPVRGAQVQERAAAQAAARARMPPRIAARYRRWKGGGGSGSARSRSRTSCSNLAVSSSASASSSWAPRRRGHGCHAGPGCAGGSWPAASAGPRRGAAPGRGGGGEAGVGGGVTGAVAGGAGWVAEAAGGASPPRSSSAAGSPPRAPWARAPARRKARARAWPGPAPEAGAGVGASPRGAAGRLGGPEGAVGSGRWNGRVSSTGSSAEASAETSD